jgi:hypothetical protein
MHYCQHWNVILCIDQCFQAYHTKKNFWGNVICIYIMYSLLRTNVPNFIPTEGKPWNLFQFKMHDNLPLIE